MLRVHQGTFQPVNEVSSKCA